MTPNPLDAYRGDPCRRGGLDEVRDPAEDEQVAMAEWDPNAQEWLDA